MTTELEAELGDLAPVRNQLVREVPYKYDNVTLSDSLRSYCLGDRRKVTISRPHLLCCIILLPAVSPGSAFMQDWEIEARYSWRFHSIECGYYFIKFYSSTNISYPDKGKRQNTSHQNLNTPATFNFSMLLICLHHAIHIWIFFPHVLRKENSFK